MVGSGLSADPVDAKTVAQTAEHSHEEHGGRLADETEVPQGLRSSNSDGFYFHCGPGPMPSVVKPAE